MIWAKVASCLMFSAVALGAFGSHALRGKISDHYLEVYQTGVLYHFIHALGLFAVAWLSTVNKSPSINIAGICLFAGLILFSGSLYIVALTGIKSVGAVTPLGGVLFITGWAVLLFALF